MQLVIDVNTHQAIQGIGLGSPVNPIGFKSQDTPALNVYFADKGKVLDLGESPVLKFGLNKPPPAVIALLVLDSTFTRQVDSAGLVFYQGFPEFNTDELVTALGSLPSLVCVGEIRYQLTDGEIVHTLDIPFVIFRTILLEAGDAPPVVIATYPDVSLIELKSNKDVASGYAALDSAGKLTPSVIPVLVTTGSFVVPLITAPQTVPMPTGTLLVGSLYGIQGAGLMLCSSITDSTHAGFTSTADTQNIGSTIAAGALVQLGGAAGPQGVSALLPTMFIFTVPAFGGTTNINVPTATLNIGALYSIQGAGLMLCLSVTDSLNAIFKATLDTQNAGASIPVGTLVQLAGANASTLLGVNSTFTVPVLGGSVYVPVATATLTPGSVYSIQGAGLMHCDSIYDAGNALFTAIPDTQNAGATIPVGAIIELAGPTGPRTLPFIDGFIEAPTAKSYTLVLDNPFAFSLTKLSIKLLSGTCTISLNISGTPIAAASPVAVTSTLQQIDLGGPQAFAVGALLELVVSSPASPVDLAFTVATQ